jgi:coenzyme PQQ biosynthesis protein C
MALTGEEFVEQIKSDIAAKHANLNHPFCRLLIEGKLTREQLQGWARQRFKGISGMDLGQVAQLYVKAPDDQIRRHVLELLGEESGGLSGKSHKEMFLDFCQALGITKEEVLAAPVLPETLAVANLYKVRFLHDSFLEALMSMACVESQNPDAFARWIPALQDHYGIPRKHLGWFEEHVTADSTEEGHGGAAFRIVEKYAVTDEVQRKVRRAVGETLSSYWMMFDGIYRAYVEGRRQVRH